MSRGVAASAVLLALAGIGTANAVPYGYAETDFQNFKVIIGGGAVLSSGNVSASTSQNYPGSTNPGGTDTTTFGSGGNGGAGVHAPNAFGGPNATYTAASPGAVGATNLFTRIGPSSLQGGYGAQAAASVGSNDVFTGLGDASYVVVENGGRSGGGPLTATGSQSETVFAITTGGVAGTVQFTFEAQANVHSFVTQFGETASAGTASTISQFLCNGSGGANDCTSTRRVGIFSPLELQLFVSSGPLVSDSRDGNGGIFLGGYQPFDSGVFSLLANSSYVFGLSSVSTESTSSIPEPLSLAVMGAGMVGLGAVRRLRRKA